MDTNKLLVGNKSDLENSRMVSYDEGQELGSIIIFYLIYYTT